MRYQILRNLLLGLMVLSLSAASLAISTEQEIQLGAQAAAQFEQKYGLVTDPAMVGRLNRICQTILQNAKRKDLPWRFRVINVDAFNAAAFPGGFVYATKGLMQGLTDEELAFVIGHEMGHVDYRHSIKQLESAQMRRLGLIAIVAGAGGGNVDGNAATLVQLTDGIIGSQYSQGHESQSDRYGMQMMALAGYDPAFALSALQKLAAQSGGGIPDFLNTLVGSHPLPEKRINQGIDLLTTIPFRPQVVPPVATSQGGTESLFADASEALEYTLSLLGQQHRASLQSQAEGLAVGRLRDVGRGVLVVRVTSERQAGISGLENALLARPEFDRLGQAFGAAVVDAGGGKVEAVVLLQGGR
jgi:Zn-dependent protease with chaperone function